MNVDQDGEPSAGPRRAWRAALPVLLAFALGACAPGADGDGATVVFRLEPMPPVVGTAELEVRLVDADGSALAGAAVHVEANMNHAGMVPTFADLAESPSSPGLYSGPVEFTMGGDWFLLLEAELADGRRLERQLDVAGVRSR